MRHEIKEQGRIFGSHSRGVRIYTDQVLSNLERETQTIQLECLQAARRNISSKGTCRR